MQLSNLRASDTEALLRRLSGRRHGAVGLRQLRARGIDARALKPAVTRGTLEQVSESVYVLVGSSLSHLRRGMVGVLDSPPGAAVSHETAGAMWDVPGFDLHGDIHVTVPRQGITRRRRLAVVHFQKDLPLDEVVLRHGIPVCTPTLTAFHLCGAVHAGRAERAFDRMTVRRLTSGARLGRLVDRIGAPGRNGTRLARDLVRRYADEPPPESGLEHRVEFLGGQAGLELDRQVDVGEGHWVGRADFRIRGTTGLIEAQSLLYHSSPLDTAADKLRLDSLLNAGFSILTIWDHQAFHQPDHVISVMQDFKRQIDLAGPAFHLDCPTA